MKLHYLYKSAAMLAVCALSAPGFAAGVEYGKVTVTQNDGGNTDTSVSTTVSGGTPGFGVVSGVGTGTNRGDFVMTSNMANASGLTLVSIRQNGRDNTAFGEGSTTTGTRYATSAIDVSSAGGYYASINVDDSTGGAEFNVNFGAVYLPFDQYVAARVTNSANNGLLTTVSGTPGITVGTSGTTVTNGSPNGVYGIDLHSFTASTSATALTASSANGVLLVNHGKNEDNYASSQANADGTFTGFVRDNGNNSTTGGENDPIAFAFVPIDDTNALAVGRIRGDGMTILGGGNFTVTKLTSTGQYALTIPGATDDSGLLIVSPEADAVTGTTTSDNIINYEWDAPNNRWIIQTEDLVGGGGASVPEFAGDTDPAFSFAFISTPEPSGAALLGAAAAVALLKRRRRAAARAC